MPGRNWRLLEHLEEVPRFRLCCQQQKHLVEEGRPAEELALPQPCPEGAEPYAAAALVDVCLAIMNANEFLYVD